MHTSQRWISFVSLWLLTECECNSALAMAKPTERVPRLRDARHADPFYESVLLLAK